MAGKIFIFGSISTESNNKNSTQKKKFNSTFCFLALLPPLHISLTLSVIASKIHLLWDAKIHKISFVCMGLKHNPNENFMNFM